MAEDVSGQIDVTLRLIEQAVGAMPSSVPAVIGGGPQRPTNISQANFMIQQARMLVGQANIVTQNVTGGAALPGGGPPTVPPKGPLGEEDDEEDKEKKKKPSGMDETIFGAAKQIIKYIPGLAALTSIAAILSQSQILKTTVANMAQVMGSYVDIALMPLVPLLTLILIKMAGGLQGFADFINSLGEEDRRLEKERTKIRTVMERTGDYTEAMKQYGGVKGVMDAYNREVSDYAKKWYADWVKATAKAQEQMYVKDEFYQAREEMEMIERFGSIPSKWGTGLSKAEQEEFMYNLRTSVGKNRLLSPQESWNVALASEGGGGYVPHYGYAADFRDMLERASEKERNVQVTVNINNSFIGPPVLNPEEIARQQMQQFEQEMGGVFDRTT